MTKFTNIDWNRTEQYTDEQFDNIKRNADGDIANDFDCHLIWMTPEQKDRLSAYDDHRRILAEEEMEYLRAEAYEEFMGG
jgi:hypothetical protein